jgi:hypothetical protein
MGRIGALGSDLATGGAVAARRFTRARCTAYPRKAANVRILGTPSSGDVSGEAFTVTSRISKVAHLNKTR